MAPSTDTTATNGLAVSGSRGAAASAARKRSMSRFSRALRSSSGARTVSSSSDVSATLGAPDDSGAARLRTPTPERPSKPLARGRGCPTRRPHAAEAAASAMTATSFFGIKLLLSKVSERRFATDTNPLQRNERPGVISTLPTENILARRRRGHLVFHMRSMCCLPGARLCASSMAAWMRRAMSAPWPFLTSSGATSSSPFSLSRSIVIWSAAQPQSQTVFLWKSLTPTMFERSMARLCFEVAQHWPRYFFLSSSVT
mmetsp:Transcript_17195/g.69176  ORF Transcript_17195/g.69176 Transcript_17195/m.69176 type:complete len:257 (+) Transcript_17195:353-1123(+)